MVAFKLASKAYSPGLLLDSMPFYISAFYCNRLRVRFSYCVCCIVYVKQPLTIQTIEICLKMRGNFKIASQICLSCACYLAHAVCLCMFRLLLFIGTHLLLLSCYLPNAYFRYRLVIDHSFDYSFVYKFQQ